MSQHSFIQRLRQHHALEHATVTILSRRTPGCQIVARSDFDGFTVFGKVDTAVLRSAVAEALERLQAGQADLAVHPNCGTNLVTAGVLAGLAAFAAGSGRKRSLWDRLPSAVLAATVALIAAVPLGRWLQEKVTTSPQVAGLHVAQVLRLEGGPVTRHRVVIQ
jgi:hypothetical protein